MKRTIKKLLSSIIITLVTLLAGFAITSISFNLFDELTRNQMRLMFACDIAVILATGAISLVIFEGRRARTKRQRDFEKRHKERVERANEQYKEVLNLINSTNFAA